jgi:hypothetical protein
MGPDIRYHIASLIAVICAAVVGVMIGANLTNPDKLEQREQKLRAEFRRVIQRSEEVRKEADSERQNAQAARNELNTTLKGLLPAIVEGRLAGKRVAIVHTGGLSNTSITDSIIGVLGMAGAEATSITSIDPKIAKDLTRLEKVAQQLKWSEPPDGRLAQFTRVLANVFQYGDMVSAMPALSNSRIVEIASDYSKPVHQVILLGGADDPESKIVEEIDRPLVRAMLDRKLNVVGCESQKVRRSYVKEYTRLGIPSTVDNVDGVTGQITLVHLLTGKRGHFGVKPGAEGRLPPIGTLWKAQ